MQSRHRIWGRPRGRKKRRALVLIIVTLGLVAALGLCGITMDIGHICVAQSELQRSADAGVLAAVAVMEGAYNPNGNSIPYYVACNARDEAVKFVEMNPCRGTTLTMPENESNDPSGDLVLGHYTSASDTFDPYSTKYNSVELFVRRDATQNGRVPLIFGPLYAVPDVGITAGAAAFVETDVNGFHINSDDVDARCKLLPFTLQEDYWDQRTGNPDNYAWDGEISVSPGGDDVPEITLYPSKLAESSGNFGTIDLGGDDNSTADLTRQIAEGLNAADLAIFPNNTIQLDDCGELTLNGDTGISSGCKDALRFIQGQPRILPLFSTYTGNGDNAVFTITRFVGVTICASRLTGSFAMKKVTIQACPVDDDTAIGGGSDGETCEFIRTPPRLRKKKLNLASDPTT